MKFCILQGNRFFWSLLLVITCVATSPALAQNFWGRTQAGGNIDETLGVTGDATGNTYATGYFSSSATINGVTLATGGLTDIFLTRVNANGTNAWSVKAGGTGSDRGLGVATDPSGNVVVCGFFSGTASFGNGVSLTANGNSQDAFVAKYNAQGVAQWARAGGSTGNSDRANAVTTDASGNIIITGQFTGDASFGALSLSSFNNTNDIFIVKYSPDGNELWAKSGTGNALNRGLGITTDASGAVYACGQFSGSITFDNAYTNTILNALFVVKYSATGSEAWMRYAGGSAQSIAYGITSNGTNVYITGDCGQSITFVNSPGNPSINTGFANAVFLAGFGPTGSYLWGTSKGSSSPVSGRGISHHNGQLGVAGWYECTYQGLSAEYGPSTFNNIGFRDVFVMRYNTAGQFQWARNFGSQTAETAAGIHILPDNLEVVCGTFTGSMIVPIRNAVSGNGLTVMTGTPNSGITYCGDNAYGQFSIITGSGSDDGFLVKAVDLARQPYDFYNRAGMSGCDLSIPTPCIGAGSSIVNPAQCQMQVSGCPGFQINGTNWVHSPAVGPVGYGYTTQWSNGGTSNSTSVNSSGTYTVTFTSNDGCYTSTASVIATVLPGPPLPTITDSQGVNVNSNPTTPVFICPGETVNLTGNSNLTGVWSGTGVPPDQANQPTITVNTNGNYVYTVTSSDGCTSSVTVIVLLYPLPPPLVEPYLSNAGDTVTICQGQSFTTQVFDELTGGIVQQQGHTFSWSISPSGTIVGANTGVGTVQTSGWYVLTVNFETTENPCVEVEQEYTVIDSVYVHINPVPLVQISLSGSTALCPGDTVEVVVTTTATNFSVIPQGTTVQGNTIFITQPANYVVSGTSTNEFGCSATAIATLLVSGVSTPGISSFPDPAVICPGQSIELTTTAQGNLTWQGPAGIVGNTPTITVDQAGLYFVEVEYYPGCALVSNTLQVSEYATPFISSSNAVLCPGGTVDISVVSTAGGSIFWFPPLTGNTPTQTIDTPGSYTVEVSACGITTQATIEVELSDSELIITQPDPTPVCFGDSIQLVANEGLFDYDWSSGGGDTTVVWVFQNGPVQATAEDEYGCALTSNTLNVQFQPIPPLPVFTSVPVCFGDTAQVVVGGPFTVAWIHPDDGAVLFTGPTVLVPGLVADSTFYVHLSSAFCTGPVGEFTISPKPLPEIPVPATDAPACTGTAFSLSVLNAEAGATYNWFFEGEPVAFGAEASIFAGDLSQEGIYAVAPALNGCFNDTSYVEVTLIQTRQVALPPDTAVCIQSPLTLETDTIFADYLWTDGSSASTFTPTEAGSFFVFVTDFNGCKSQAIINIDMEDCSVIVPNVFTPNGDGANDTWVISVRRPGLFRVSVYNRWGTLVYESDRVGEWWNGDNYRTGEPCSEGVYFYILDIVSFDSVRYNLSGTVTLIRE